MTYRVIATDYDGTLAHDGRVDAPTLDALRAARDHGIRLIMVTGRELPDLFNTFEHTELFDRIVAENGALLYDPGARSLRPLSIPAPAALIEALRGDGIPVSVGHSIVATVVPHHRQLLTRIRDLGLEWHVIFNKSSIMALPADVTKATGLAPALEALQLTARETIGIGDAENDEAFLRTCGLSVAVDNALPSVKEMADVVLPYARGAGVTRLIEMLLGGELESQRRR